MDFLAILTSIGGICGTLVTIIGFISLVLKKPKAWIKKIALETHNEQMKEVIESLKNIEQKLDAHKNADICSLRHEITSIYEKYKDSETLPINIKQDLCSLYENYISLGGNSYVRQIYDDMMEWEVN